MRKAKAKLVRLKTLDGLFEVKDEVRLGKIYTVDLDSTRTSEFLNTVKNVVHTKEIILAEDDDNEWYIFPLELLDIYKSTMDLLELSRVVSFQIKDNKLHIREECDGYFQEDLSKDEALSLVKELSELIDKMS